MNKSEFIRQIEDILEIDENTLTGAEALENYEGWDSLALLSVIAMADEQFDIVLEGEALQNVNTTDDLVALVKDYLTT
jgi:acyl carrier protein